MGPVWFGGASLVLSTVLTYAWLMYRGSLVSGMPRRAQAELAWHRVRGHKITTGWNPAMTGPQVGCRRCGIMWVGGPC